MLAPYKALGWQSINLPGNKEPVEGVDHLPVTPGCNHQHLGCSGKQVACPQQGASPMRASADWSDAAPLVEDLQPSHSKPGTQSTSTQDEEALPDFAPSGRSSGDPAGILWLKSLPGPPA